MYIIWRDSMYYSSELEHIVFLTDTEEEAINHFNEYYNNDGTNSIDIDTFPYVDDFIEFERPRPHFTGKFYLSEIPFKCDTLYILQCVGYDGSVTIFFSKTPASVKKELQKWINICSRVEYDIDEFELTKNKIN